MTKTAELADKVAVVTGSASTGIGRETAMLLADAGATVVLADLPGTTLQEAAEDVRSSTGSTTSAHFADISDEESVQALIAHAVETHGGLDILVNNAARLGVAEDGVVGDQRPEVWDGIFAVNARGTMLMCKHALPAMLSGGGGSIVNISSCQVHAGDFFATAYACSKAAVSTLTKYVATQYADGKVRCNAIAPGLIRTPTVDETLPEEFVSAMIESKLSGRLGERRDVAEMALFLASDRSSFITGEVLHVDGGLFAHLSSAIPTRNVMAKLMGAVDGH
jgi:NAD(P)-dependent dehydrogenase (short-subunit alcohol dehydrogenase family)